MWPSQNNLQAVNAWLKSMLDHDDEREAANWARALTEFVSKKSRTQLLLGYLFSESELNALQAMSARLNAGEPLQHITGEAWFMGHRFRVNEHTLIPRPETEELVAQILQRRPQAKSILDIGTGSGCIAISLAEALSEANVVAYDVSQLALDVAERNADELGVHVLFSRKDILTDTPNESFDVIVSNPPYIPAAEREEMDARVTAFEPAVALFTPDDDPLLFYRRIAGIATMALSTGGLLAFECHERYATDVVEMLHPMFSKVELKNDLQGKPRMVFAERTV
ncbi:MAG: peptide chain release factor N(5)-glutamine methyltransferase [Cryomorphaceae bacterium]|nr:peptide chain release factor N(5)-glutamine methyltransferase [Cryomorphaceae bacterium]